MNTDHDDPQETQDSLKEDQRGAVMVEFLIAFLPIFFSFWCILQSAGVYAGKLVVMHSAYLGARAAGVVLPDDPKNYGGAKEYSLTGKRKTDIEKAVPDGFAGERQRPWRRGRYQDFWWQPGSERDG